MIFGPKLLNNIILPKITKLATIQITDLQQKLNITKFESNLNLNLLLAILGVSYWQTSQKWLPRLHYSTKGLATKTKHW